MENVKAKAKKSNFKMSSRLKPCPFCGREVHIEKDNLWNGSHGYHGCYMYKIVCHNKKCKINPYVEEPTIYQSEIEAIEKIIKYWNRRAK